MVHAAVLRSPFAHARIRGLDAAAALAEPGVIDVISFKDIAGVDYIPMRLAYHTELMRALQRPLANDFVRYVGEPVAVVVAGSRYDAEDALELIEVDYEALPVVTVAQEAMKSPVLVHAAVPDNVAGRVVDEVGSVERALADSDHVLQASFSVQRHSGVPMETRGLVAEWDSALEQLTVWGAAKVVHFNRSILAHLMELPESRIHMIEMEVGGGFGIRGEFYPEDFLIPFLARRLRRPICWIEDRAEHLVSANQSREQHHQVRVGVDDSGRILAFDDTFINDMGAYIRTHGATTPTMTVAYLPGPYRIPNYRCEGLCVLTNKTPTGTYRAPGRFEASFVRERVMDLIALHLGLDPIEVRRRNFISPEDMPYDVGTKAHGTPVIYDSGDYGKLLTSALERFRFAELRDECVRMRAAGRAVGLGIGAYVEKSGLGPWEYARVDLDESGLVSVYSGAASVGQGLETVLAQIAADEMHVEMEDVRVIHGDTDVVPYGNGSFATRGMVMAGNSAQRAAAQAMLRLRDIAGHLFEASPNDLVFERGRVSVRGVPERVLTYGELVQAVGPGQPLSRDSKVGVSEEAYFHADVMTYPYGVHLAMVEVDRETGKIDILKYLIAYDVGRAINPMLVEGQLVGGFAQGLGGALLEESSYSAEGQPLAASFMDYLIPTSSEIPVLDILLTQDAPSGQNPMGIKGAGEGGTTPVGATLANAICDALGEPAYVDELPLSPDKVRTLVAGLGSPESTRGPVWKSRAANARHPAQAR
jgi:carbon-monoxide dehydrogenase large subunit/6-hydroxypseudooxynicotine dehydrogenase subunit gamma